MGGHQRGLAGTRRATEPDRALRTMRAEPANSRSRGSACTSRSGLSLAGSDLVLARTTIRIGASRAAHVARIVHQRHRARNGGSSTISATPRDPVRRRA